MTPIWLDLAACAGHPVDTWFRDDRLADTAKTICRTCPVQTDCLNYAFTNREFDDHTGIYGGMTPRERRREWRRLSHRYRAPASQSTQH